MTPLELIQNKIIADRESLERWLAAQRFKESKIVFTNGCFDILHRGHIELLAGAANYGDLLIVGLNTDDSVKRLKGENRPLQDEQTRAMIMASLRFVDLVVFFNEDTPAQLIDTIVPNVLIKGGDYIKEEIVGYETVTNSGGEVVILDFVPGFSTTSVINRMG